MLVYRVENENGTGPYMAFHPLLSDMRAYHGAVYKNRDEDPHPNPYGDGLQGMDSGELCGLASPEAAQAWFEGYGDVLDEAGFEMTVWEAQDVREGRKQVVFRKDTARMVASYPIMEYIE